MTDKRINDPSLSQQTSFINNYKLLVDFAGLGEAKAMQLSLLGNTYFQGSTNGITWADAIVPSHTKFRFSTDGGSTWKLLDSDTIPEGTNEYYTEAKVSANTDVATNTTARHTHSNKSVLDNIIDTGASDAFLAADGTYKTLGSTFMEYTTYDIDQNGVVDDSEKLNSQLPSYYLDRTNHTNTQLAATISDFQTQVSANTDVLSSIAHITADGSSHTFIDQDVTTTSSPTFIITNIDSTQFDIAAGVVVSQGEIAWNADEDTLDIGMGNGVVLQTGQELVPLYKNQTGSTITNGTPVMFAGALGASGRILIQPAIADGTITASYIIGMATEDILNGTDGHVTWFGKIRGIDTSGTPYGEVWADGDVLYVSPTTDGYLTKIKPSAPNLVIEVAAVVNAHVSTGTLFCRPTWLGKIQDMSDVNGTPLTTDGQFLVWDNTNQYFDATININDYAKLTDVAQDITANSFITDGGTSSDFVKGDGSLDSNTYLTSYTETDPIVGAINGIVKADGAGTISSAISGTDYQLPLTADTDYLTPGTAATTYAPIIGAGAKSTATDAGTVNDLSLTDDYLYVCVQTGTAGNAKWKKTPLSVAI